MAAVCILHFIHLDIFMVYRHVIKFGERDTVKTGGKAEYSIDAVLKLEIRLQFLGTESIFSLLVFL